MSTIYQIEPKVVSIFTVIISIDPGGMLCTCKNDSASPFNRHIYLD